MKERNSVQVVLIVKKDTKVAFEPDGIRPIYCPDCLKLLREGKIDPVPVKKVPINKALTPSFIKEDSSSDNTESVAVEAISGEPVPKESVITKKEAPIPRAAPPKASAASAQESKSQPPPPQRKEQKAPSSPPSESVERKDTKPKTPKIIKQEPVEMGGIGKEISLSSMLGKNEKAEKQAPKEKGVSLADLKNQKPKPIKGNFNRQHTRDSSRNRSKHSGRPKEQQQTKQQGSDLRKDNNSNAMKEKKVTPGEVVKL